MSEFQITLEDIFDYGFKHGREDAIGCCFGEKPGNWPWFETAAEADAYEDGYNAGYNSIDD